MYITECTCSSSSSVRSDILLSQFIVKLKYKKTRLYDRYDAELQAIGKYRISGGRPIFLGNENLHLLESPDIKVPDLWKSNLRDYSPQNELLRIQNEKREEKRRHEQTHSPLPLPRVVTPTRIVDRKEQEEEDSDIDSLASPATNLLVHKKVESDLAKKVHSEPLAAYVVVFRVYERITQSDDQHTLSNTQTGTKNSGQKRYDPQ